ncbi:MAG: hypothetical protein AAF430_01450 [Myxococcota bacterium]
MSAETPTHQTATSDSALKVIPEQLFEARLKANALAESFLKQLVTLASAALVLSVGFFWDALKAKNGVEWVFLLPIAWLSLVLAAFVGAIGVAMLVNNLDVPDQTMAERDALSIDRAYAASSLPVVCACWGAMIGFVAGIALFGAFAARQIMF